RRPEPMGFGARAAGGNDRASVRQLRGGRASFQPGGVAPARRLVLLVWRGPGGLATRAAGRGTPRLRGGQIAHLRPAGGQGCAGTSRRPEPAHSPAGPGPARARSLTTSATVSRLMAPTVVLLPGDGIGPEIIGPTVEVLGAAGAELEYEEHLFGGA